MKELELSKIVDQLGDLRAEIEGLLNERKALEDALIDAAGEEGEAFDGSFYRAVVSRYERESVAWKKIAEDLGASRQKIRANTSVSDVASVRVSALKNSSRRAA